MNPYTSRVVRSAAEIDPAVWKEACGPEPSATLDIRFLRVVERAFGDVSRFWYVTFFDEGRPIACACYSTYPVDAALMAPEPVRRGVAFIRRFWKRFLRFELMMGGLPASTCGRRRTSSRRRMTAGRAT